MTPERVFSLNFSHFFFSLLVFVGSVSEPVFALHVGCPELQPSSGSCPLSTETHSFRRSSPLLSPLFSLFPSFLIPFFPTPFLNKLPRTLWLFSSLLFLPFHLLPHLDQGFLVWVSQYSLLHSHGYSLSLDPSVALLHAHWIVFCFCF